MTLKNALTIERRTTLDTDIELRYDESTRTAFGYAAVFETRSEPLGGFFEEIDRSAFNKTLQESDVRALFNHDISRVLGRMSAGTLKLGIDTRGVPYEIKLPNTPTGDEVAELMLRGDITGSSFGFRTVRDDWERRDGVIVRTLREVAVRDVGPVTFPAYSATDVALRSLAEARSLPLEEVLSAAESDSLALIVEPVKFTPARRRNF